MWGILFLPCLFVCLSYDNFNFYRNFWAVIDRDFIFGIQNVSHGAVQFHMVHIKVKVPIQGQRSKCISCPRLPAHTIPTTQTLSSLWHGPLLCPDLVKQLFLVPFPLSNLPRFWFCTLIVYVRPLYISTLPPTLTKPITYPLTRLLWDRRWAWTELRFGRYRAWSWSDIGLGMRQGFGLGYGHDWNGSYLGMYRSLTKLEQVQRFGWSRYSLQGLGWSRYRG